MSDSQRRHWTELTGGIDNALRSNPALSGKLMDDVDRLKREIAKLWRAGKHEEAERAFSLAMSIVKSGAAVKE